MKSIKRTLFILWLELLFCYKDFFFYRNSLWTTTIKLPSLYLFLVEEGYHPTKLNLIEILKIKEFYLASKIWSKKLTTNNILFVFIHFIVITWYWDAYFSHNVSERIVVLSNKKKRMAIRNIMETFEKAKRIINVFHYKRNRMNSSKLKGCKKIFVAILEGILVHIPLACKATSFWCRAFILM